MDFYQKIFLGNLIFTVIGFLVPLCFYQKLNGGKNIAVLSGVSASLCGLIGAGAVLINNEIFSYSGWIIISILNIGVKIDNLVQIAHNVEIGTNTVIASQTGVAGSTKVGKQCVFAGQVGIAGHLHIADGTILGAQTGVPNSIKTPNQAYQGYPAVPVSIFRRSSVVYKNLSELQKTVYDLQRKISDLEKK